MSVLVPLSKIVDNPWQTRQHYDDDYIAELAGDIERNGLLQPAVGRVVNSEGKPTHPSSVIDLDKQLWVHHRETGEFGPHHNRVQIAIGHNRLRALRLLHEQNRLRGRGAEMPIRIGSFSDEEMACFAWSENEQRKDLTPLEEALAIKRRMDDFGWTQEQVAQHLGIARSTVANKLRLLELPEAAKNAVNLGTMSERTAMALLPLCGLPGPLDEAVRSKRDHWNESVLDDLIEKTATGELRSDEVRQRAERLLRDATYELDIVDPEEAFDPADGMQSGVCNSCQVLVKAKNYEGQIENRCGDSRCLEIKRQVVATRILEAASAASGLPVTAERDRDRTSTFDSYGSGAKLARQLQKKGCPHGRLHIRLADGRYHGALVEGHDRAELVCVHAASGKCTCQSPQTKAAAAATETRTGRAKAKLIGEERYVYPARVVVFEALLAQNPEAWDVALQVIRAGSNTDGSYGELKGFCKDETIISDEGGESANVLTFDAVCRFVTDWILDVERHHYDYPDSLERMKKFALSRLKPMGLSLQEPDYGDVDIDLVAELATASVSDVDSYIEQYLDNAGEDTLRETLHRITDEDGKPTYGNKTRAELIEARLQEIHEERFAGDVEASAEGHVVRLQTRKEQIKGSQQPNLSGRELAVLRRAVEAFEMQIDEFRDMLYERERGCLGRLQQLGYLSALPDGRMYVPPKGLALVDVPEEVPA